MSGQPSQRDIDASQREEAFHLYRNGYSHRAIGEKLGVSHVTIGRWSKAGQWRSRIAEEQARERANDREGYLNLLAQLRERNLAFTQKAYRIINVALDSYCVYDTQGNIVDIKRNQYGVSAIPAVALVQLVNAVNDMELKTLGMQDGLPQEDVEKLATLEVTQVVDADLAKKIGDWVALQELEPPASS